jgi:hypothetical protein
MDLDRYPSHNTCKSNIDQDQSIYSWVFFFTLIEQFPDPFDCRLTVWNDSMLNSFS